LVRANSFEQMNEPVDTRFKVARDNAAKFISSLCTYPGLRRVIEQAQEHILTAHAERLTKETGRKVTAEDIKSGQERRPQVLDMFAGGGAIPLEALRLGCDVYALDVNPVAHLIELGTLVYPDRYGAADPKAKGCSPEGTWAGLSKELRHWGTHLLRKIQDDIGDLYPTIVDPDPSNKRTVKSGRFWSEDKNSEAGPEHLVPIAYLWTRTVPCKKPNCQASVPLVRQTWLCKRTDHYVALRTVKPKDGTKVRFEVVEASSEKALGFDPEGGSARGNATCPFCGTVADNDYIKEEGKKRGFSTQLLAVACIRPHDSGKVYISGDEVESLVPSESMLSDRLKALCKDSGISIPDEPLPKPGTLGFRVQPYGFKTWGDLFTTRQKLALLTFAAAVRRTEEELRKHGYSAEHVIAITTYLGLLQSTVSNSNSTVCRWIPQNQQMGSTFSRQALPMTWDFVEIAPFGGGSGDTHEYLERQVEAVEAAQVSDREVHVTRGSATSLPWGDSTFDAVITDPPYYDNVPYADLSDFFYVWLRRTVGHLHSEHFASSLTPKKAEAIAEPARFNGSMDLARAAYEQMMLNAFREAARVLKAGGHMSVIYAHKTTLGWATLVDALRQAGFMVTEAWPLDTEKPGRLRALDSAALASSIVLVGRKRDSDRTGQYEDEVREELESVVRERVTSLWLLGISGADLVISCVGAGLRAFTRHPRVEYRNGDEVPAERFLTEVETVVLETILARLSEDVGGKGGSYGLAGVDAATRFYTLWRYTYKSAELEAGEAIIFANGTHVELDGPHGLSQGSRPLVEKRKGKYRLLDYSERGDDGMLGVPSDDGQSAPLVDALHRLLWLMERHPSTIPEFLREAKPNTEQMRLVAQALAGPALKGGELGEVATGSELAALTKLSANWRNVVENAADVVQGPLFRAARTQE
jgi:putative DNA methylase